MDELFGLHADGVFQRREALEHGYLDKDLVAGLRGGLLARIRPGAYTRQSTWAAADPVEQHRLRAHAVLRSHSSRLALSHTSAAVEHGLRLYRPDLTKVHVTTLDRKLARTTPDVVYHQGAVPPAQLVEANGCAVTSASRAALEAASLVDVQKGLVILDSVLDLGLTDLDAVQRAHEAFSRWPGARSLQIAVRLARPGAGSVGETLARHLMWIEHLPEPVLQYEVRDNAGTLVGRSDFCWPEHGLLGEFDGVQKYGRLLRLGETPGDAVVREKVREDALRSITGFMMVRLIWPELFTRDTTGARIRAMLRRSGRLIA